VLDGHQMGRLRKAERIAAIEIGTAKGLSREVMAERLGLSVRSLSTFARRHELPLPPPTEPLTGAAAQCYSAAMAKQQHDTTTTKESK
jgi:transcriptional regulator with XRE-family HTH domain